MPEVSEQQVIVRFQGEGEGVAELTWGQLGFWQCTEESGRSATMGGVAALAAGTTVAELADLLRYLLSRHQTLRTRLRIQPDGQVRQVCSASGQVSLAVIEAGDGDPVRLAERVQWRYAEQNFDYQNEWPIRMAVITQSGVPSQVVVMYLHLALDAGGLSALLADLATRDPVSGAPTGPVAGLLPLEQARRQRQPAAQRQSAASLKHLEQVLRMLSPDWFGKSKSAGQPSFRMIRYRSPAAALAIGRIAVEQNTNTASALLAVFAVGLARYTGDNPVVAMLMVSNRFRPGFAESVSAVVQISPYLIDIADITLAEAVARAGGSLLHTYKNAYYDPHRQRELIDRLNSERGFDSDFCFYNDRRRAEPAPPLQPVAGDQQLRDAVSGSSWSWERQADISDRKLYLNVDDSPGAIDFVMSADSRYLNVEDLHELLRMIEAAAVETALDPDAATGIQARRPAAASNPTGRADSSGGRIVRAQ